MLPTSLSPILKSLLSASVFPSLTSLDVAGLYHMKDIAYGRHVKQQLDIIFASEPFPRKLQPVLLFVHGGAWQRGDKNWNLNLYWNVGVAAARAGAVGVICNYRLTPEVQHPAHLNDVGRAFQWIHQNIHLYGGDASKLILCGHSAGAHLAVQLATEVKHPVMQGYPTPAGLIGISGVYNIARLGKSPFGPALIQPVFGSDPTAWRAASPAYVCNARSHICGMPTLLINAAEDFHLGEDAEELDMALSAYANPGHSRTSLVFDRVAAALPDMMQYAQPRHSLSIRRLEIPSSNHMTIIGSVGQPSDSTTKVITAFIDAVS